MYQFLLSVSNAASFLVSGRKERKCLTGNVVDESERRSYGLPSNSHAEPSWSCHPRYFLGALWGTQEFQNRGLEKPTCCLGAAQNEQGGEC